MIKMNEVINWIATNNTLMIRVGFSAILILLILYCYRFFFVPKVNVVEEAAESNSKSEKNINTKSGQVVAAVDANVLNEKTAENEKLKSEIASLTNRLSESEKLVTELKSLSVLENPKSEAEVSKSEADVADLGSVQPVESAANKELIASLNEKITQLETRLTEYEIIAEDISEISQLRKENSDLKKKLSGEIVHEPVKAVESKPNAVVEPEPEPELVSVPKTDAESSLEPDLFANLVNDMNTVVEPAREAEVKNTDEIKTTEVSATSENIKFVSEKEVLAEEKDLIGQFEAISNKKG